ncbi:TetR/AcrR family transcriptional regulator [Micromonospora sp. NPDC049275]|uniref:TetR/AcrR family transcriptional regulator n=1 Tax=Micromonospora sp. NPDC049275 TaxID=3364268 RepID=UPI00371C8531
MTEKPNSWSGGGSPDKRRAIIEGALAIFSRDGYTRAGLDAIAAEAGVSSRTIYNHFKDKASLFEAVIEESSRRLVETQLAIIDRHLHKIVELEGDLVAFGIEWISVRNSANAPHFALVRQIHAEAEHIPAAAIAAWQENGPQRVRRELADRLCAIAERHPLKMDDPERAAGHLMVLISSDNLPYLVGPPAEREVAAMVAAGVHTFLHGYQA